MRYHIVSDNLYFLLGVRGLFNRKGLFAFIYYSCEQSTLELMRDINDHLKPGDVLVCALNDIILRQNVLKLSCVLFGRILFMPFFTVSEKTTGSLPWVLNSTVTEDAFFILLKKMETATYSKRNITDKHMETIGFLTSGKTINELVMATGWTAKKLYYQRTALLKRCGLTGTTDHEVLLCRDILTLLRRHNVTKAEVPPSQHHLSKGEYYS